MIDMYIACAVLVMAVIANSVSVYVQKQHKFYTRKFGIHDQLVHSLVILPIWIVFTVLAVRLHDNRQLQYELINLWIAGAMLVVAAVTLFALAIRSIGTGALVNANFFKPQKEINDGVYKYFKNPIYDSYALLLFGIGLIYSNWGYFVLSALIWLLLIYVESNVETV